MLSTEDIRDLQRCRLFRKKCEEGLGKLLQRINYDVNWFNEGEIIVTEGEQADYLGIVLGGSVEVKKIFSSGKSISMARLNIGETFGEAVLFSAENVYPATIIPPEKTRVMLIKKSELETLITLDRHISITFLETLSDRLLLLNRKIQILSLDNLRKKIAMYLINESSRQESEIIRLPFTKETWAQHLGVARPSLSRELMQMQKEGLVEIEDKKVTINDMDAMEEEILR